MSHHHVVLEAFYAFAILGVGTMVLVRAVGRARVAHGPGDAPAPVVARRRSPRAAPRPAAARSFQWTAVTSRRREGRSRC